MKFSRERIRNGVMMAALVFFFGGIGAITSKAQEVERIQPSESPKAETPSAPAESPRSDPAPSSPSSSSPSSSNNDNGGSSSSRGSDSGNSGSSNNDSAGGTGRARGDDGRKAPKVDADGNVRRSSDRSNGRERVLVDKMPVTTPSGSGGSDSGRGRDRDRDRDRDRWRGRGHDRDRHRNRQDDCYLVPDYDNTVIYQPATYPTSPADSRTAYERGYDDGIFTGAHDGRRNQTYDPERSHFYKDAPGYRSVLGSRDVYKQAYRDGFLRGYREGFQNWQKYFVGGEFRR